VEEYQMRRFILLVVAATAAAAPVPQASAKTAQFVTMTFAEPIHPSITCPGFPDVSCGMGEVRPLGQATETVVFGAGCGGTCDLRTINLAGGSLVLDETAGGGTCPQVCRPGPLELGRGELSDIVVGATGIYTGASGMLTGTVRLEGSNARPAGTSTVKLAGTLNYP
jgi:hypothetical protein